MRVLLCLAAMIALLSCRVFAQDEPNPAERLEKDFTVELPIRKVPAYPLEELARLLSAQSDREIYVDARVKEKLLLIQLPEGTPLSANALLAAMSRTTRLKWRRVDAVLFLTLYEEGALRKFGVAKQQEMRQTKESILKSVVEHFGELPIATDNFKGGTQQRWNDLSQPERGNLFSLFSKAETFGGTKPFQLSDLAGGTFWFTLDFQLVIEENGSDRTTAIRIMN
jgi:hypothetical protein